MATKRYKMRKGVGRGFRGFRGSRNAFIRVHPGTPWSRAVGRVAGRKVGAPGDSCGLGFMDGSFASVGDGLWVIVWGLWGWNDATCLWLSLLPSAFPVFDSSPRPSPRTRRRGRPQTARSRSAVRSADMPVANPVRSPMGREHVAGRAGSEWESLHVPADRNAPAPSDSRKLAFIGGSFPRSLGALAAAESCRSQVGLERLRGGITLLPA
jgi:hypothetical protein